MRIAGSESLRGSLAIAGAATLWGTWKLWLVGPALDSGAQCGLVLTTAGLICSGLAFTSRRQWPGASRRVWLCLLGFGAAEAVNSGLYFLALSSGDTATAAVTHYLAPVMIALASPFLGLAMGRRAIPAALIAFGATAVLVGLGSPSRGTALAAAAGAGSAVFYAVGVFLSKRMTTVFRPLEIVGFHDLVAGPLVFLTSRTPLSSAAPHELYRTLTGAVVGGVIATSLFIFGLGRVSPARAGTLAYIEPVSVSIVGALFLNERLGSGQLLAMLVIILAGVAVVLEPLPETLATPETSR